MKVKTTKKTIKEKYSTIIKVGYCNAEYLLKFENVLAYSTRSEGWACDYYDIDGILISTGYAPIDSKNASCNYDLVTKYEDKARKICCNYQLSWEEQKTQVKSLLNEFIKECINND